MAPNVIAVLILLFLLFRYKKKYKSNVLANTLFVAYILTFVASVAYSYLYKEQVVDFEPILYLTAVALLWILPFNGVTSKTVVNIYPVSVSVRKIVTWYGLITLVGTFYFAVHFFLSVSLNYLIGVREVIIIEGGVFPATWLTSIFALLAPLYFINIFFFFISIRDSWSTWITTLLFFSSLIFPFHVLGFLGRDGVLFWLVNFGLIYWLFKDVMNKNITTKIKTTFLGGLVGVFFILMFFSITEARFGASSQMHYEPGVIGSIIIYFGMQPHNFNESYNSDYRSQGTLFRGTSRIIGARLGFEPAQQEDTQWMLSQAGIPGQARTFATFIRSLIFRYGKYGAILVSVVFFVLIRTLRKQFIKNNWFFDFIVLLMIFQVPMNGVFYYRQGIGSQDFSYLVLVFLYMLIRFLISASNPIRKINLKAN